jgi:hypothetical protein
MRPCLIQMRAGIPKVRSNARQSESDGSIRESAVSAAALTFAALATSYLLRKNPRTDRAGMWRSFIKGIHS